MWMVILVKGGLSHMIGGSGLGATVGVLAWRLDRRKLWVLQGSEPASRLLAIWPCGLANSPRFVLPVPWPGSGEQKALGGEGRTEHQGQGGRNNSHVSSCLVWHLGAVGTRRAKPGAPVPHSAHVKTTTSHHEAQTGAQARGARAHM